MATGDSNPEGPGSSSRRGGPKSPDPEWDAALDRAIARLDSRLPEDARKRLAEMKAARVEANRRRWAADKAAYRAKKRGGE